MPFMYELTIVETEPEYTVKQHLVPAGTLVDTGQPIAVLSDGETDFHLPTPRQGLLVEWHVHNGSKVKGGTAVARFVGEGPEVEVNPALPSRIG